MYINLIYNNKKSNFKYISKNNKVKIIFFKTNKNIENLFNFILEINEENISNFFQVQIIESELERFIKNKIVYYQKEQYLNNKTIVFRYTDKLLLKEIILKL